MDQKGICIVSSGALGLSNYLIFITIHFCDLFSRSLKVLGRGRLHYLIAGDESVEARARDAFEEDIEGASGARRISF